MKTFPERSYVETKRRNGAFSTEDSLRLFLQLHPSPSPPPSKTRENRLKWNPKSYRAVKEGQRNQMERTRKRSAIVFIYPSLRHAISEAPVDSWRFRSRLPLRGTAPFPFGCPAHHHRRRRRRRSAPPSSPIRRTSRRIHGESTIEISVPASRHRNNTHRRFIHPSSTDNRVEWFSWSLLQKENRAAPRSLCRSRIERLMCVYICIYTILEIDRSIVATTVVTSDNVYIYRCDIGWLS